MGGLGAMKKKNMADDGTTRVTFRFWPIQLADLFSNLSWLIQDDTNLKLFQDCAKLKSALLWLDSPITWESTNYLRGIVLWRLYRKTMSIPDVCKGNGVILFFNFWAIQWEMISFPINEHYIYQSQHCIKCCFIVKWIKIRRFLSENDDVLTFTLISAHATSIEDLTELAVIVELSNSIADYMEFVSFASLRRAKCAQEIVRMLTPILVIR